MLVYIYIYVGIYMLVYIYVGVYMLVYIYVGIYICWYIYVGIYMLVYICWYIYIYICWYTYICICCMFIAWRVHGRFYGLDLKGNVNDEEIDCRLEDQRNLDLNMTCVLSGKGCWSFILTKLFSLSTYSGIGCDTSYWCKNLPR